jgi:hypothetical protein
VQNSGINLDFDLFFKKRKAVDQVHGLWTAQEWSVHGSTIDLTVAGGQNSLKLVLAATPGHGDLRGGTGGKREVRGT